MGRARWIVLFAAVTTTAALLPPAVATAASTTVVACGSTITVDTRLAKDLRNCPGIGIVIGADGVDLDLGGHIVDGDGVGDFEGINVDGHRDTSVHDGAVRDFVEGVALLNATAARVSGLALSDLRHVGVFVSDSTDVTVSTTRSRRVAASGIFVTRSRNVAVLDNDVAQSGGGVGMRVSQRVRIAGNTVSDVDCGGIVLLDGGTDSVIEFNQLSGRNGCDGITLAEGSNGNVVSGNVVSGAGGGVGIAGSDRDVVTDNTLRGNTFVGVYVQGGDGNVIDQNTVVANGEGSEGGVHLLAAEDGDAPHRTTITGNAIGSNVGDGVLVDAGSTGTVLARNVANRNTDDGIDVDAPATTLTSNTANDNGDLGIEAVPGVRAGGNTASGNGDPRQCVGVACG
jgi:parallel beta-helix repeat protein